MYNKINIETQIRSLTKLLDELRNGNLQVPPFQRDFVWDRDAIKDLFDSIRNNYPIGSILLWKPKTKQPWKNLKKVGSFYLPIENDQKVYLLDGYQRMSSLFGCLTNPLKSGLKYDDDERHTFFDLYFDLEDETFLYLRYSNPSPHQVPVYILMSTSDFRQYSRKHIEPNYEPEILDVYLDRADAFSRSLIDYKLAVIEISDAELSDAVNIFSRINSKGTDISMDWMVNALSYRTNFHFAYEIDALKQELSEYHFDSISRNNLFRCYQSAFDDKLYIDQTNIESLATRNDFSSVVREITPCIKLAAKFLYEEMNVLEYKLLPYNLQLIFIMMFFRIIPNPNNKQLQDLKKWFWITTYSNYFTIYSLSNQRLAFTHFLGYLRGKSEEILYYDNRNFPFKTMPFPKNVILSAVRSKALILFELKRHKELSESSSLERNFSLIKISNHEGNSPENLIASFSSKQIKDFLSDRNIRNLDNITAEKYFLPNSSDLSLYELDSKEYLKARKKRIVKDEQSFVNSLNIEYNKINT